LCHRSKGPYKKPNQGYVLVSHDEDSITMAVADARDCLSGFDGKKTDGLCLATIDQNRLVKVEKSQKRKRNNLCWRFSRQ
jgi:hypothetical protein